MKVLNKGDIVYYARIIPSTGIYDLCELKIRTIYPDSFVGVDKHTKQALVCDLSDCDIKVFERRNDALKVIQEAEKNKKEFTKEVEINEEEYQE